jgi:iron complex outermembrane receptor protein
MSFLPGAAWAADGTAASDADAAAADDGSTIVVEAKRAADLSIAQERINRIPGGASIIDSAEVNRGRAATVTDLLAYQPGVFVQQVGGNDAIKVSVRGSGLNSAPGNMTEGIKYLFDGVGLTGPGGTSYEFFEPLDARYTEVLRGANAFDYGAVTLGGAVNFASRTGITDPGLQLGIQGGSYGYVKAQAAYGIQHGALDFHVTGVYSSRDGFQAQTQKHKTFISANLGIALSDSLTTRFFGRYADERHMQSGLLTLAQLRSDPRQTSAAFLTSRSDVRKLGSWAIGNRTDWTIDDHNALTFGINYSTAPQHINTLSAAPSDSRYSDLNLSVQYRNTGEIFGRPSETTLGWTFALSRAIP